MQLSRGAQRPRPHLPRDPRGADANIAALRDPETRRAFAEAVGTVMGNWVSAHPAASLEERAEAFQVISPAKALEVCGKRERWEEGWFAAHRHKYRSAPFDDNLLAVIFVYLPLLRDGFSLNSNSN